MPGYTISDDVIAQLADGTYPNLDEIVAEASGIEFAENWEGPEDELEEILSHEVEHYKFCGLEEHAVFQLTLDNGQEIMANIPLYYFSEDSPQKVA